MAKDWKPLVCEKCKKVFIPYTSTQKYCQEPCTANKKKTIQQANQAWIINKKPKTNRQKNLVNLRFLGLN